MRTHFLAAATFAAVLLAGILACSGADEATDIPSVSGVVLNVTARSLTQIDVLTVRDESGVTWDFQGGAYKGYSPSHLREHMLQGLRVTVSYREENGVLVIDEVADYMPEATPPAQR